ncbi:MAG: magnesium transporter [Clostridia bacterium]|nr:magnesium transporter [Clostridia bacterium]
MDEEKIPALNELLNAGKFGTLKSELSEMNEVDIAEFFGELEPKSQLLVFRILPKDLSSEVFAYLEPDDQVNIVNSITDRELSELVDELFLDDTVDFLEEVPANVVTRVLKNADKETRKLINRFLQYPENSAGSIMTIEMVQLHDTITVGQAIETIRRTGIDKETIYTCYCIDKARHLIGTIDLSELIFNDDSVPISDIMEEDESLISVKTLDDQEEVADIVRKYDLLSVPVTDNEGRLVGIITVDDIVDIIDAENTEDFEKMAKVLHSDESYLKTSVFKLARNRIPWLLILMISATFTGRIIEGFEGMLAAVAGLTAAIPMLMDTGGNAGNQTSTLAIRGLATGDIEPRDYIRIFWKELRIGVICGSILAVANMVRLYLLEFVGWSSGGMNVFLVICSAMFCAVVIAKVIGCTLPLAAKAVKLDPALMAGPMITTIVDAVTLLIYLGLAKTFLSLGA